MATDARPDPVVAAHSPQLDGLRAVAVAAVAWSHWLPGWQFGLPLGAGVHLFFVLSGFLITRILLRLRAEPDWRPAIGRFYLRRILRLVPAFAVVLAAAVWADVPRARETWAWHASYLSNLFIAREAQWQGHFSHFWSLAVEEQFYLVWPWLVVAAPSRWLGPLIGAAILLGPLSRLAAATWGLAEPFWALVPGGSADSLGLGAWLAFDATRQPHGSAPWLGRGRVAIAALAAWTLLAVVDGLRPLGATVTAWRQVLQGLVFAWIVWRGVFGFSGIAGALLSHRVVRFVGRISYGVYLVHAFAPVIVFATARALGADAVVPVDPAARAALYATTSVVVAAVLWTVVERPLLRLKTRVPYHA